MDKKTTIEEYIQTTMNNKIACRTNNPTVYFATLAAGVTLLVSLKFVHTGDSLQMVMLTGGLVLLAIGLVLTAMWLSGALWHYIWLPTRSRMKEMRIYMPQDKYATLVEGLKRGDKHILEDTTPAGDGNSVVRILYSRDRTIAIVQACHEEGNHLEPDTTPLCFNGDEPLFIKAICK